MRLTRYTDYSLRVLMYLALKPEGLVSIGEIAERHGISENHLMKVVNHLGHLGYIAARRGRSGGLRLACSADDIAVGEVVRRMESELALADCLVEGAACPLEGTCRLQGLLGEAMAAFMSVLDGCTVADLVRANPDAMRRRLACAGPAPRAMAPVP